MDDIWRTTINPKDILNNFLAENPGYEISWQQNTTNADFIMHVDKGDARFTQVISCREVAILSNLDFCDLIFKCVMKAKEELEKEEI